MSETVPGDGAMEPLLPLELGPESRPLRWQSGGGGELGDPSTRGGQGEGGHVEGIPRVENFHDVIRGLQKVQEVSGGL